MLGATLAVSACGCVSTAIAQAAASSAAAAPVAVLLPFTITFDALLLGLLGAAATPRAASASGYSGGSGFQDPGDWVAQCKGPLICPRYRHFVCTGRPGACECHCEVTPPACVPAVPEDGTAVACEQTPPVAPAKGRVAAR